MVSANAIYNRFSKEPNGITTYTANIIPIIIESMPAILYFISNKPNLFSSFNFTSFVISTPIY